MMISMNTVRTTITLPADLHEKLRLRAVKQKKSLEKLIAEKYGYGEENKQAASGEKEFEEDIKLFDKLAERSKKYDAVKAVREERDRDNA